MAHRRRRWQPIGGGARRRQRGNGRGCLPSHLWYCARLGPHRGGVRLAVLIKANPRTARPGRAELHVPVLGRTGIVSIGMVSGAARTWHDKHGRSE
eukprot:scaffold41194_cov63-Phaeocystis_antarctica.AAC.1